MCEDRLGTTSFLSIFNMWCKLFLIYAIAFVSDLSSAFSQVQNRTNVSYSSKNIKVGLLFSDRTFFLTYLIFKPSCDIAVERVNAQPHLYNNISLSYEWSPTSNTCGRPVMTAPGIASKMYYTQNILAVFGPPCSTETGPIADLANFWNIPILSGTSTASYMDDKSRYRTLTRTSFVLSTLGDFFVDIFARFKWTAASLIWENKTGVIFTLLLGTLSGSLGNAGVEVDDILLQDHSNSSEALVAATKRGRSKFVHAFCL